MDKQLMKTNNNQYFYLNMILVVANGLAATIVLFNHGNLYIFFILLITSIIVSLMIRKIFNKFNSQLDYLIQCSDKITTNNHEHLEIIDGEGKISVLSHKLYILNERFLNLLEKIDLEKVKLKDYIEDISHQIKTPITSMQINEELLLAQNLSLVQKEKLNNIHEQTININNLVEALLRLAKVEANSVKYDFQEHDLLEIVDNVENILTPLLLKQKTKINYLEEGIKLNCDFLWFSEAIENIVKNCIEYNPNSVIDITAKKENNQLVIEIQDYGQGFDKQDLNHLFERFYSAKNTKGFGIGLALSKEIIKAHHGLIEAKNNKGALFIITLPLILTKKKVSVTN